MIKLTACDGHEAMRENSPPLLSALASGEAECSLDPQKKFKKQPCKPVDEDDVTMLLRDWMQGMYVRWGLTQRCFAGPFL